ncbi:hypothetical protein FOPG_16944 [Fusarium oxysporum f. sp. conglutinans race 2 54008]|uniref:Uncharacterized protein n=1 Tax=Fusarium oxysporum f. sp. conglutinans race 2 54008 TaxID=1089457 RepID=X0GU47_FUSOX|nr:hypothetical protein FOPG_16944 [Fusarium oxysporum f. sp. conglutinans race 2 54008]
MDFPIWPSAGGIRFPVCNPMDIRLSRQTCSVSALPAPLVSQARTPSGASPRTSKTWQILSPKIKKSSSADTTGVARWFGARLCGFPTWSRVFLASALRSSRPRASIVRSMTSRNARP